MQHSLAVQMLSGSHWNNPGKQVWADLGCGTGTFTLALAHHLGGGSRIIAIDKEQSSLNQIPEEYQQVIIETKATDFTIEDFQSLMFNGILMANSLQQGADTTAAANAPD